MGFKALDYKSIQIQLPKQKLLFALIFAMNIFILLYNKVNLDKYSITLKKRIFYLGFQLISKKGRVAHAKVIDYLRFFLKSIHQECLLWYFYH